MSTHDIASALRRVETVMTRRPDMAISDDAPATACWHGGTRVVTHHANGTQVGTDMPAELGGSGRDVTPGWLLRASLASCATTSIALQAAAEGFELSGIEVRVCSRSDVRGLLGLPDGDGRPIDSGPRDVELLVCVAARAHGREHGHEHEHEHEHAHDHEHARLHALVERALRHSPVPSALRQGTPYTLRVEIAPAGQAGRAGQSG